MTTTTTASYLDLPNADVACHLLRFVPVDHGHLLRALMACRHRPAWDNVDGWRRVVLARGIATRAMQDNAAAAIRTAYHRRWNSDDERGSMVCVVCGLSVQFRPRTDPFIAVRPLAAALMETPALASLFERNPPALGKRQLLGRRIEQLWRRMRAQQRRLGFDGGGRGSVDFWWLCVSPRPHSQHETGHTFLTNRCRQPLTDVLCGLFRSLKRRGDPPTMSAEQRAAALTAVHDLRQLLTHPLALAFERATGTRAMWRVPTDSWTPLVSMDSMGYASLRRYRLLGAGKVTLESMFEASVSTLMRPIHLTADGAEPERGPPSIAARWGPRKRKRDAQV